MRPTIKKGSRGEDVKVLQKALNLLVDGIFGVITDEAVRDFQSANGLAVDGIVGAKTWAALSNVAPVSSDTAVSQGTLNLKKSKRTINMIVVHCTATEEGKDYTVEQIRRMHTAPVSKGGRGWSDIGYHYVIYRDGTIHQGRDVNLIGAHVANYNSHSVGIVYVGGTPLGNPKGAKDTRTPEQKKALVTLLKELKKLYPKATIHGHREFANKGCPCFDAKAEYSTI